MKKICNKSELANNGLTELIEECGELIQIVCKIIKTEDMSHYSPTHKCTNKQLLEKGVADVIAICQYVAESHDLNQSLIVDRIEENKRKFANWKDRSPKKNCKKRETETFGEIVVRYYLWVSSNGSIRNYSYDLQKIRTSE